MPGKRLDESKRECVRKLHEYFQKELANGGPLLPLNAIQETRRQVSLDRFIARISSTEFNHGDLTPIYNKINIDETYYYVNTARDEYRKQNYRKALRSILSEKNKILDVSTSNYKEISLSRRQEIYHWPVEPRNKPLLPESPYTILDMPDLDSHLCKNIVDWGKSGYIATIYDSEVHLWHPEKKIGQRVLDVNGNIVESCLKWNKQGKQFALSMKGGRLAIFDVNGSKKTANPVDCACRRKPALTDQNCTIISVEWTSSNYLVIGCSKGTLSYWSACLQYLRFRYRVHIGEIIQLKISCKEKYLASAGMDCTVVIWKFPEIELVQNIKCLISTKAIAWHPWRNSLLVVGEVNHYYLWNVQNKQILCSVDFPNSFIDCLTFNPMSAELLVSLYNYSAECDEGISYIKVMKNLDCVVDEVRCNNFRIPYLLWNNTGTKLGTASTEENFCIWDFFGRSTKQEEKYLKMEKKIYSTKMLNNLNILGSTIR